MPNPHRVSGRDLQASIIDYAHLKNWRVAHFPSMEGKNGRWRTPVQADGKGWPDLFLVREGRILVIEVKGDGDTIKPEQEKWLQELHQAGLEVQIVRPGDWPHVVQRMLD